MSSTRLQLRDELSRLLGCAQEDLSMEAPFHEIGVDSLVGIRLIGKLSEATGLESDPTVIFDYPSIRELADYIDALLVEATGVEIAA